MRGFRIINSVELGWHIKLLGHTVPFFRIPSAACRAWRRRFEGLTQEEEELVLRCQFKELMGTVLDMDNPRTFCEKLAWEKIYYRNPLMNICADKVKAREYFCRKIQDGQNLLVRQLAVCDSFDEIDFAGLPLQFVLKSNWGSGAQVIVRDKSSLDPMSIREKVSDWLLPNKNHYYAYLEWGYKNIEPKIVIEELLEFEYKLEFFCFNGTPRFFWIVLDDKTVNTKANFYDLDWVRFPLVNHYPNFTQEISRPSCYDEMVAVAKKLCGDFPFVRCDFYVTKNGYKFSEMTFYHWGGYNDFKPASYDMKFGEMMELPLRMCAKTV